MAHSTKACADLDSGSAARCARSNISRARSSVTTRDQPSAILKATTRTHEYIQHAAECREMARTAQPFHRQQLEQMAETWEQLAKARKAQLEKQGKAEEDEVAAE